MKSYTVSSLDIALNILSCIASNRVCSSSDIAGKLNINKRSVQRYLKSLEKHGYVRKHGSMNNIAYRWYLTEKSKMFELKHENTKQSI